MAHEAIADCVTNVFTKFWRLLLEIVFSELNSKYTNYLMNQPRNPVKKLDSKLHKQRIGSPKTSNTARKILQRWKSAKITTAKFKYMREHVLGHDWLNKVTWNYARREKNSYSGERAEFRIPNLFFLYNKETNSMSKSFNITQKPAFAHLEFLRIKIYSTRLYERCGTKTFSRGIGYVQEARRRKKKPCFRKWLRIILEQSQSTALERD